MSRITFQSRTASADVRGNERAHMGCLTSDLFCGLLVDRPEELAEIVEREGEWKELYERWKHEIEIQRYGVASDIGLKIKRLAHLYIGTGWAREKFRIRNKKNEIVPVDIWDPVLNTALAYGSDALKLFTFLHAQCEVHLWVAGKNRAWMAELIKQGLRSKIYRKTMGWESVIELLESSSRGSVVTEYSVSESFYWKNGLPKGMELTPHKLATSWFGDGYTVDDLNNFAREEVQRKKLEGQCLSG